MHARSCLEICFLAVVMGATSCDGAGRASQSAAETTRAALAANTTANSGAQAKADAYSQQAAVYTQLASTNRAAAAVLAGIAASQSAAAETISTSARASSATSATTSSETSVATTASVDPAVVQRTLAGL